jgi:hypothetical protein
MKSKSVAIKDDSGTVHNVELGADGANIDISDTTAKTLGLSAGTDLESVLTGTIPNKLGTSGDASNTTATFSRASSRTALSSGATLATLFSRISKWLYDLKTVAFTGSYSDLSGTPDLTGYTTKSSLVDCTIGTSWGGEEGAWTQIISVAGVTASNTNYVKPADSCTDEERTAFFALQLRDRNRDGQGSGELYLYAEGTVNTVTIPITVTVMGDG